MKRLFVALSLSVALLFASGVCAFAAEDGASLYKACQGCHGAEGEKLPMGVGHPIKGQSAEDLDKKMHGYKDGSYGDSKKAIMTNIVKRLTDEQIKALADHMAAF